MVNDNDIVQAAPRPWSTTAVYTGDGRSGGFHLYIVDAKGRKIAAIWGKALEKTCTADMILDAVNSLAPRQRRDASIEDIGRALLAIEDAPA